MKLSMDDITRFNSLQQHLAYEQASDMIDGLTGPAPVDDYAAGPIWHDLSDADCDLSAEVFYLDARRLIDRHPGNLQWIQIREEQNPLPVSDQAVPA